MTTWDEEHEMTDEQLSRAAEIAARKRRRSANDPDYSEEVRRRAERRRQLPFRRAELAWLELADAIVGPALRWLARRTGR